jgi:hypothetical protein
MIKLLFFGLPLALISPSAFSIEASDPFETAGLKARTNSDSAGIIGLQDDNLSFREGPFAYNFFSLVSTDGATIKQSSPQIFSYNYVGMNYRMNQDEQLSIRPAFLYTTPGRNSFGDYDEGGLELHDTYLQYAHFNALNLPGGFSTVAQLRWYLPTGRGSRERKTFGRAAGWFIFNRTLPNSFQLNYHVRPSYFFQSSRASISKFNYSDGSPGARVRGNQEYEFYHYLELGKILNPKWAIAVQLGHTEEKYYESEANNLEAFTRKTLNTALNFRYNLNPRINFIIAISNNIQRNNDNQPMKFGRDREMNYALLTFIRL